MADRCDLTELPAEQCACRLHRNLPDPMKVERPSGVGPAIPALYPGRCPCGETITPGDDIRSDGDGGWVRAECCGGAG